MVPAKSEKGTRTEHHKTTDVVGLLALYWTIAATPLLLIHVQASGHEVSHRLVSLLLTYFQKYEENKLFLLLSLFSLFRFV